MVSEKPPRRSNREKEPVTIDLTPEEKAPPAPDSGASDIKDAPAADMAAQEFPGEASRETDVLARPIRSDDSDGPDEPYQANLTEDKTSPTKPDDASKPKAGATEPAVVTAKPDGLTSTEKKEAGGAAKTGASPTFKVPPTGSGSSSTRPAATSPAFDEPKTGAKPATGEAAKSPKRDLGPDTRPAGRATSTSALLAAGIAGGIVALILAGSMQYAGYLPAGKEHQQTDTSDLANEIAALRKQVETLSGQGGSAAGDLAGRVAALESRGTDSGAANELARKLGAVEGELSSVKSAVAANEAKINDRGPEQQVARAVAAAALKSAIDRGGSFGVELQTYESLAGGDPSVAKLKAFAAAGVPSRADLQKQFPAVADAMLEAVAAPDPNQNLAARLFSSATSVVKVRRVGDVQGETPDAIVARLENKLVNGDLQGAAFEWNALPEPAKATSADFKKKLDARITVEDLVGGTLSRALAGNQGQGG